MLSIIRAGWRARRNLRIYRQWVEYFEQCSVPAGVMCEECTHYASEVGTVDQCRDWVKYYEGALA